MKIKIQTAWRVFFALLIALAIYLAWLWQPARQVRKHQQAMLDAAESRSWQRVAAFLAADYQDQWKQDRALAISDAQEAFRYFLILGFTQENVRIASAANRERALTENLRIVGSGEGPAMFVKERVNQLTEPFTFIWKRESWKPWDWRLVEIRQPQLQIPRLE